MEMVDSKKWETEIAAVTSSVFCDDRQAPGLISDTFSGKAKLKSFTSVQPCTKNLNGACEIITAFMQVRKAVLLASCSCIVRISPRRLVSKASNSCGTKCHFIWMSTKPTFDNVKQRKRQRLQSEVTRDRSQADGLEFYKCKHRRQPEEL